MQSMKRPYTSVSKWKKQLNSPRGTLKCHHEKTWKFDGSFEFKALADGSIILLCAPLSCFNCLRSSPMGSISFSYWDI